MAEKIYPSAKPNAPPPPPPTTKPTQFYNPIQTRPVYNNHARKQKRSSPCTLRRCCCLTFIYTLITLFILILLLAITGCVFYALYHPKHPTFSISTVKISHFNITAVDSSNDFFKLNSKMDFTLTTKNPNEKHIAFIYDNFNVDFFADGVDSGRVVLPGFTHVNGNTSLLRGSVKSDPTRSFDSDSVKGLKLDLNKKTGFKIRIKMDTKVKVKVGKFGSGRVGFRVQCDGVRGFQPTNHKGKSGTIMGSVNKGGKCKVGFRFKIWKFTF